MIVNCEKFNNSVIHIILHIAGWRYQCELYKVENSSVVETIPGFIADGHIVVVNCAKSKITKFLTLFPTQQIVFITISARSVVYSNCFYYNFCKVCRKVLYHCKLCNVKNSKVIAVTDSLEQIGVMVVNFAKSIFPITLVLSQQAKLYKVDIHYNRLVLSVQAKLCKVDIPYNRLMLSQQAKLCKVDIAYNRLALSMQAKRCKIENSPSDRLYSLEQFGAIIVNHARYSYRRFVLLL